MLGVLLVLVHDPYAIKQKLTVNECFETRAHPSSGAGVNADADADAGRRQHILRRILLGTHSVTLSLYHGVRIRSQVRFITSPGNHDDEPFGILPLE